MHFHPIEPVVASPPRRSVRRRLQIPVPRLAPKAAASLVALAWMTSSCEKPAAPTLPPPMVQVAEATLTNVPMATELIGKLDSPQNVEVRARVEAFVEQVLFTEGLPVAEGELLFELDRKPFEQRLAAARGALAEAEAALNKYRKDVSRLEPLARDRAIPQQDLDNAMASVEIGKASVLSAEARVQSALIDLNYCEVRAPIRGLIGAKEVSIGELVGKGSPTLLATISKLDPIWFYGNVSEVQFLRAEAAIRRTGRQLEELPIDLILADGTTHPEQGKFVFLDRAVDSGTGTLRVRAEFPNPEQTLRPGMFARIKVHLGARPDSILVPERAVVELQGRTFLWVIDADNRASQRPVRTGETIGSQVLVVEGLRAGERFVVEGLQKAREGLVVQPQTAAPTARTAAPSPVAARPEKE